VPIGTAVRPGGLPIKDILLQGVVGSTAYGLATAASDVDRLGVFLAPLDQVLGVRGPDVVKDSKVSHEPDLTLHEVGKFVNLALKSNPTILELLFLPGYEICSPEGQRLVDMRQAFLSQVGIRAAYGGYARQQARRLVERQRTGRAGFDPDLAKRTAKHGRHCYRLILMGSRLLATGDMEMDVSADRDAIFAAGELAERDPEGFQQFFETEAARFEVSSSLPEHPDVDAVDAALVRIRMAALPTG
jgi:predicted nucleotidyltransferase